jgi:hypothetical protein
LKEEKEYGMRWKWDYMVKEITAKAWIYSSLRSVLAESLL